jgi:hypothetical protein
MDPARSSNGHVLNLKSRPANSQSGFFKNHDWHFRSTHRQPVGREGDEEDDASEEEIDDGINHLDDTQIEISGEQLHPITLGAAVLGVDPDVSCHELQAEHHECCGETYDSQHFQQSAAGFFFLIF